MNAAVSFYVCVEKSPLVISVSRLPYVWINILDTIYINVIYCIIYVIMCSVFRRINAKNKTKIKGDW